MHNFSYARESLRGVDHVAESHESSIRDVGIDHVVGNVVNDVVEDEVVPQLHKEACHGPFSVYIIGYAIPGG